MRCERPSERSSVTVLMSVVVVLTALSALLLGGLGAQVATVQRSQATADAVALAGVTGGRSAAAEVAQVNSGSLDGFEQRGATVVVRVRHGGVGAEAAARPTPR